MSKKILLCLFLVVFSVAGFAGENGKFGLLFKADSIYSVGASFQLSKRLSLRPTFGFNNSTRDYNDAPELFNDFSTDNKNYTAALGLFYHFLEKKDLSIYGGIEFGYTYGKSKLTAPYYSYVNGEHVLNDEEIRNETFKGTTGNLILGVSHKIGKKVALFGEIGFGYIKNKYEGGGIDSFYEYTSEDTIWNLNRSGIGIIFYL
jgi:long-subunit fatty acid transport protein